MLESNRNELQTKNKIKDEERNKKRIERRNENKEIIK